MRISDWSSDLCSSDLWVDFPAGASRQEIDAAFGRAKALGRIGCVYLESPANPTNQLVDIAAVAEARDAFHPDPASRPPVIIDNTFLGPLWQTPLKHGADLVVYSLTKYACGHRDLVAGGSLRSEGRRVGKEGASPCSSLWSPDK